VVRDVVVGAMIENIDGEAEFLKSWSKIIFGGGEMSGPVLANCAGCQFFTSTILSRNIRIGREKRSDGKGKWTFFLSNLLCPRLLSSG
jgi:hypothetical protein